MAMKFDKKHINELNGRFIFVFITLLESEQT